METPRYPNAHPQVANVAIGQAANLARNIRQFIRKGSMTIHTSTAIKVRWLP
jgi:hypothetical protein